jgi:hypothetical protein
MSSIIQTPPFEKVYIELIYPKRKALSSFIKSPYIKKAWVLYPDEIS